MPPLTVLLNKLFFLISLLIFCPFTFAIRASDITGTASVVILLFISALLIFHILFTIIAVILLSKKWNKSNRMFKEIRKNITKK